MSLRTSSLLRSMLFGLPLLAALTLLVWWMIPTEQAASQPILDEATLLVDDFVEPSPAEVTAASFPYASNENWESIGNANCRIGISAGTGNTPVQQSYIPEFKNGWYLNFGTSAGTLPSNVEFTPMIGVFQLRGENGEYLPGYRVHPPMTPQDLGARISSNPGALWIVGNEVERVGQGDIHADQYAIAYHDLYEFIKQYDPTATIAPSALVQVTPARLAYLDLVWESYRAFFGKEMPVDAWTMHLYILPEVRPDGVPNGIASMPVGIDASLGRVESGGDPNSCSEENVYCFAEHDDMAVFAQQVIDMRVWMRDHGYLDKPLLISEYSILYPYEIDPVGCFLSDEYGNCFDPERVSNFVVNSFAYLESAIVPGLGMPADAHKLVQQWLWYSFNTELAGDSSDLLTEDLLGLTAVGTVFKNETLSRPLTANIFPDYTNSPVVHTDGGTASATLSVRMRNNGNAAVNGSFWVTFYDALTHTPIGSTIIPGIDGCARRTQIATAVWSGLGPGFHDYYVLVDSTGGIPESNEDDNRIYGTVFVDPAQQIMIPIVGRGTGE